MAAGSTLEQLLTERGLIDPKAMNEIITTYEVLASLRAVSTDEVSARAKTLAQRPSGHDHRNDHAHPH